MTIFFFILVFFLFTPSVFIGIVTFLIGGIAGAIVGGYLPVILVAIYTSVLIPIIIKALVRAEKRHTKGAVVNSEMLKFLLFFSGQMFVLPVIVQPLLMAVVEGGNLAEIIL